MRAAAPSALLFTALAALAASPLAAQETAGPEGSVGWYVVKPGDTLEQITGHFLGDESRWPENHRLNPDIKNPHLLHPGQRIRVLLPAPRKAEVRKVERSVDEKPYPQPWTPAKVGDRLKEKDGVRTHESSSAELGFDDGTRLVLTENSLVFLREMSLPVPTERRDSLEVVEGQADLLAHGPRARSSELEIVMGNAKARPTSAANEPAAARARLPKAGGPTSDAQLMVFSGQSDVEAAGAKVSVSKGMGTSVPRDGPPRPPEKLLTAPRPAYPEGGATLDFANPGFAWGAVDGAASYTIEICRDTSCGQLLARAANLKETRYAPERLPAGMHYWRVSAVGASGLDGYASEPLAISIRGDRVDGEPPAVAAYVRGKGEATSADAVTMEAGASLVLEARDDLSGVAEVRYRWDDGTWASFAGGAITPPPGPEHRLEYAAVDRAGHASRTHALTVKSP